MMIHDIPTRFQAASLDTLDAQVRQKVEEWLDAGEVLLITGPTGVGKSWTAAAAAKAWQQKMRAIAERRAEERGYMPDPKDKVLWSSVPTLAGIIRDMEHGESVIAHCREAHLLVLDDLGSEKASEYLVERFYSVIDHRYAWIRPYIVSTNLSLATLAQMWPRMASRLGSGVILSLSGSDRRLKGGAK